jgi:CelD/BcsL family acetyltransferase involved in cellulose biosynthesis
MYVERISTSAQIEPLADAWNRLAGDVAFRSWIWLVIWWRHFGHDLQLYVLTVRDDAGQLQGLAPWCLERCPMRGRVIRFLGSGKVCSDYMTVLSAPGRESEVVTSVADWLSRSDSEPCREDRWDLLEMTGADASDLATQLLGDGMRRRGHAVAQRPGVNCWRLALPESWEAYLQSVSKPRRKELRRFQRRMFDTGRAVGRIVTTRDELPQAMEILQSLHQKRWQSRGQSGCFSSRRFTGFLNDVARELLDLGRLRLRWLEVDGQPAAADLDFVSGRTTYGYQSGIDPEMLCHSPGSLSQIINIRSAIEENHIAYDMLRGDEPYKQMWRAVALPTTELRVSARRPISQLRHGAWLAGGMMKGWLKHSFNVLGTN